MILDFREITIDDKQEVDKYLKSADSFACEMTFGNFFIWRKVYNQKIAFKDGFLFLNANVEGKNIYLPPIGNGDIKNAVNHLINHANSQNEKLIINRATENIKVAIEKEFGKFFSYNHKRETDDYIYKASDLANLQGRAYNAKRNHYNKFIKSYKFTFEKINKDNKHLCYEINDEWCEKNGVCDEKTILNEKCAVKAMLTNFEQLGAVGAILKIGDKGIAFAAGTPQYEGADRFDVNFEKALSEYNGVFAAINKLFASQCLSGYKYINREEDVGIPGLRKAKLSYNPEIILRKYMIKQM